MKIDYHHVLALLLITILAACASPSTLPGNPVVRKSVGLSDEINELLRAEPLMDALADRYRSDWTALVASLVEIDRQQLPASLVNQRIRDFQLAMAPRLRELTSNMPDALLPEFFSVKADTYAWYGLHQPSRCEQALEGGRAGHDVMQSLFATLRPDLRQRHVDIMVRIVRATQPGATASSAIQTAHSADHQMQVTNSANSAVAARPVGPIGVSQQPASHVEQNLSACLVIANRLRRIRSLAPSQAIAVYRQLLPVNTPAIYQRPASVVVNRLSGQIEISGRLGQGTAQRLVDTLQSDKDLTTVVLNSEGGLLSEGFALAGAIRKAGLRTRVDQACASACTIAFLAGTQRWSHPHALIGFHRPSNALFVGERTYLYETIDDYRRLYTHPGIDSQFLSRVASTPSTKIWYPDWQTLRANGIVTHQILPDR